jgi:thioredoxin-related protein
MFPRTTKNTPRALMPGACLCLLLLYLLALAPNAPAQQSESIRWLSYAQILEQGPKSGKPVFIFFRAPWCAVCKKMQRLVFPDPQLTAYLNKYYLASKVDVTKEQVVAKLYKVNYLPTCAFLTEQGKPVLFLRGYYTSDRLLMALRFVAEGHYKTMNFQEFESR